MRLTTPVIIGGLVKYQKRTSRNGTVSYYVRVHVGNGKYQTVGTFPTKKAANAAYEDAKRNLRVGDMAHLQRIGFTTFVETVWLSTLTVRSSTLTDYKNTSQHLCSFFGNRHLQAIKQEDVAKFVAAYSAEHSPYTTKKAVTRLRQILGRAVAWGYLTKSPASEVSNMPRAKSRKAIHPLERDQVNALLAAMDSHYKPLVRVAVSTGLRRGELFGLTWRDVLWNQGMIRVAHQLQDGELVEPKSESARRKIDVSPELLAVLKLHRETCPETALDLVFTTKSGQPILAGNFHRGPWNTARNEAGLPDLKLHDLRHTFASLLIHQGESVKYVQTVMGHASAQQTLDVYGHLFESGGQNAAQKLENAVFGAS